MLEEGRTESILRWHLYRRWRNPPKGHRLAEYLFYRTLDKAPRGGIFIDLGANVGKVAARALEYGHKVYAFEPDPTALAALRSRLGDNFAVEIIPKAVGATSRTAKFYRRPDEQTEWSSLTKIDVHEGGEVLEVEVVDIVEFIRGLGRPVTVLKMDIEGAEAECLEAILDAGLHRSIGMMLVETHDRFSPELAARLDAIRARIARENITNINLEWV